MNKQTPAQLQQSRKMYRRVRTETMEELGCSASFFDSLVRTMMTRVMDRSGSAWVAAAVTARADMRAAIDAEEARGLSQVEPYGANWEAAQR